MGALIPADSHAVPEDEESRWFRVEEPAGVIPVRRAATALAESVALPAASIAKLAIVVAEMSSNLVKHAVEGTLALRAIRQCGQVGIEAIAVDRGPGMSDLALSGLDGYSTAGTLGIGLGAIARQSTWCQTYSQPGRGTVLAVQVWPDEAPGWWARGIERPMTGEQQCGDGYAVRTFDGRSQVLVSDGLGHGPLAHLASRTAIAAFHAAGPVGPAGVVEHLHRALVRTRGAAVLVVEIEPGGAVLRAAGLGNVAGSVVVGDNRRGVTSLPGIAGHQRRGVREYTLDFPPGARFVAHSDGVSDRWSPTDYPGLFERDPVVVAATILRDAGTRRDDASVLVAVAP
ncbi:MAG TPA: SpoIIE family protein phosphatase [Micromonosporaceae bacterium]